MFSTALVGAVGLADKLIVDENEATDTDRANGFDIADYIISELCLNKPVNEIQSYFSPTLQSMIDKNQALFVLINELQLKEV